MTWILGKISALLGKAAAPLLAKLALAVLAIVLALVSALGVQTYRVSQLTERVAELRFGVGQCVEANRAAKEVIDRQREAMEINLRQRAEELRRQQRSAERIRALELEVESRANEQIRIIERTVDDCADRRLPDSVRLLFDRSSS